MGAIFLPQIFLPLAGLQRETFTFCNGPWSIPTLTQSRSFKKRSVAAVPGGTRYQNVSTQPEVNFYLARSLFKSSLVQISSKFRGCELEILTVTSILFFKLRCVFCVTRTTEQVTLTIVKKNHSYSQMSQSN